MAGGDPLVVRADLVLPSDEIELAFARSGGPGGQNVNKVESKVILRFCARRSRALSAAQRERVERAWASRLTTEGDLVIHAARFRDRERNLTDARERLADLLRRALEVPKARRPTKPTRSSGRRRIEGKRRRSDVKRGRKGGGDE